MWEAAVTVAATRSCAGEQRRCLRRIVELCWRRISDHTVLSFISNRLDSDSFLTN